MNYKFALALSIFSVAFSLVVPSCLPSSCAEILLQGNTKSGIYTVHPRVWYSVYPFKVYCDMDTDGGGWTVFQRRDDYIPRESFYRNWRDYKRGFGDLNKEFWLGNELLYVLTNQDHVTLRIDLEDFEENTRKAEYSQFKIKDEINSYQVTISGYHGNATDSLTGSQQMSGSLFATYDRNDVNKCAEKYKGGWWYVSCHDANPNGLYLKRNTTSYANGITWGFWRGQHYSLKKTEMKVRPTNFKPNTHIYLD